MSGQNDDSLVFRIHCFILFYFLKDYVCVCERINVCVYIYISIVNDN